MNQISLKIPSANEFAPGQIGELQPILKILSRAGGNRKKITDWIIKKTCWDNPKRVNNVLIGLRSYGIIDDDGRLTDVGQSLSGIEASEECYEEFAKYILKERSGLKVLQAIDGCHLAGEKPTKANLANQLNLMGIKSWQGGEISTNSTDHTQLLAWLAKAGLAASSSSKGYSYNKELCGKLLGFEVESADEFEGLTSAQRAFLEALKFRTSTTNEFINSSHIVSECKDRYPKLFVKSDQLAKEVFTPLEAEDWIEIKARESKGRGGKAPFVKAAKKLSELDLSLIQKTKTKIPNKILRDLHRPLPELLAQLDSNNTYEKGIALELLSVKLSLDLGLIPVSFRERSNQTGGAEVDLIADGAHLHYSRWLIQCKNVSSTVSISALAKEIGMATLMKAHVIVLVTTSKFTSAVVEQAEKLARETNLQAILVSGDILQAYVENGADSLIKHFKACANGVLLQKREQTEDSGEG